MKESRREPVSEKEKPLSEEARRNSARADALYCKTTIGTMPLVNKVGIERDFELAHIELEQERERKWSGKLR